MVHQRRGDTQILSWSDAASSKHIDELFSKIYEEKKIESKVEIEETNFSIILKMILKT